MLHFFVALIEFNLGKTVILSDIVSYISPFLVAWTTYLGIIWKGIGTVGKFLPSEISGLVLMSSDISRGCREKI